MPPSAPVAPRGAAVTAASASSLPWPKTLLSAAVPPHWVLSVSWAVPFSSASVRATSPSRAGAADQRRATEAAVCGEAMEVPEKAA